MSAVVDVAFIAHAENVQNSYMQFGGKGVANSYFCYSTIRFSMSSSAEISVVSSILHHSHFFAFAFSNSPSHSHFSHTFNGRIFYALGSLRDATNKLMHTRQMFQKNGSHRGLLHPQLWCFSRDVRTPEWNCCPFQSPMMLE